MPGAVVGTGGTAPVVTHSTSVGPLSCPGHPAEPGPSAEPGQPQVLALLLQDGAVSVSVSLSHSLLFS